MKPETLLSSAGLRYAEAYKKHYDSENLRAALLAYNDIVIEYPDSKEAGYSRSQIRNIAQSTVPEHLLYEAQFNLALKYSNHDQIPVTQTAESATPVGSANR